MSDNFWDTKLSETEASGRSRKEPSKVTEKPDEAESNDVIQLSPAQTAAGLFGGWAFAGIWCGVSFLALFLLGGPILADLGTSDWEPTNGVIIDSGVSESTGGEGGTTYCLWVNYDYTYDNNTYSGDVVSFSKDNSCSSWAGEADEDYPAGQEITVYVNPDNPYESVLETGFSGVDFWVCCIFPFPLIGIILLVGMLKRTFQTISSTFNKSR